MDCSCPDWAGMCKHVAAVMYGVGARLDQQPELLFTLPQGRSPRADRRRGRDGGGGAKQGRGGRRIAATDLADVFGVELDAGPTQTSAPRHRRKRRR